MQPVTSVNPFVHCPTVAERTPGTPDISPAVYTELRRIAARHLNSERRGHTLQPTALVHEAYLKVGGPRDRFFADDVHFLATASRAMRQILVDYARTRCAQKRQAAVEIRSESTPNAVDVMHLDTALTALAEENELLARLIEMRYFGGMTAEASAEALGISVHVARHHLRYAHAWLRRRLSC